jgi:hypothetical protein
MLIDGGVAVNLMPYSVFKKLGREDGELMKTNMTLNGMGGNPVEARGFVSMELTVGESHSLPPSLLSRCKVTTSIFCIVNGFIGICISRPVAWECLVPVGEVYFGI